MLEGINADVVAPIVHEALWQREPQRGDADAGHFQGWVACGNIGQLLVGPEIIGTEVDAVVVATMVGGHEVIGGIIRRLRSKNMRKEEADKQRQQGGDSVHGICFLLAFGNNWGQS